MKILYGVASEGMGHAIRSKPILKHLLKEHKLTVVAGGKAYEFLSRYFKTIKIEYLDIKYKESNVKILSTFFLNLISFPKKFKKNKIIFQKLNSFNPDIVISDFEPFSHYYAYKNKKPLISIDNQNILTQTNINYKKKSLSRFFSKRVIKLFSPHADHYLITSFFIEKLKNNKSTIIPPILRESIINAKIKEKNHILVYLRTTKKKTLEILKNLNENFIVYGLDINKIEKNIQFKKSMIKNLLKTLLQQKL